MCRVHSAQKFSTFTQHSHPPAHTHSSSNASSFSLPEMATLLSLTNPAATSGPPRAPVRGDKIPGIGHSVANATVLQLPGLLLAPRVSSSFFHDGNLCVPVNVLARTTKRHVHRGGANPKEGPGHGICDYWLWNPSYSIETTGSLAQLGARIRLGARRPRTTYPMSQRKK